MLYMKEQRPTVRPAIRLQGSGAVSAFLGLSVSVAFLWPVCVYTSMLSDREVPPRSDRLIVLSVVHSGDL